MWAKKWSNLLKSATQVQKWIFVNWILEILALVNVYPANLIEFSLSIASTGFLINGKLFSLINRRHFNCVYNRRAFQNLFTLLKPGGEVLLSFLGTCPIFEVYLNISKNIRWAPWFKEEMISPYHNSPDPQRAVEKILSDTGFAHWKCIVENRRFVYPNCKKMIGLLHVFSNLQQFYNENCLQARWRG